MLFIKVTSKLQMHFKIKNELADITDVLHPPNFSSVGNINQNSVQIDSFIIQNTLLYNLAFILLLTSISSTNFSL